MRLGQPCSPPRHHLGTYPMPSLRTAPKHPSSNFTATRIPPFPLTASFSIAASISSLTPPTHTHARTYTVAHKPANHTHTHMHTRHKLMLTASLSIATSILRSVGVCELPGSPTRSLSLPLSLSAPSEPGAKASASCPDPPLVDPRSTGPASFTSRLGAAALPPHPMSSRRLPRLPSCSWGDERAALRAAGLTPTTTWPWLRHRALWGRDASRRSSAPPTRPGPQGGGGGGGCGWASDGACSVAAPPAACCMGGGANGSVDDLLPRCTRCWVWEADRKGVGRLWGTPLPTLCGRAVVGP